MILSVTWLDASGAAISTLTDPVVTAADRNSQSSLIAESATGAVPIGAVTARVVMDSVKTDATDNDGLADNLSLVLKNTACYCRGTRILTERGEVAVEDLKVGDHVITVSGGTRPITWIGHRNIDITRHPDPKAVRPIRVEAGAFGEAMPSRDLWLSPDHAIAWDGVLIAARLLVNGRSVAQKACGTVEYWHVELDNHDILIANGLPAESYLDTGNRTAFVNGGAFIEAHPDFEPKHWAATCLPIVHDGEKLTRAKMVLIDRLDAIGQSTTADADVHLMVDGRRIEAIRLASMRFAFMLPPGSEDISLKSRTFVPVETRPDSLDTRSLGLCVMRLQVDGEDIRLDDPLLDSQDWHAVERGESLGDQRWTRGSARMPAKARLILIDLAGRGYYWQEHQDNVVALFGT